MRVLKSTGEIRSLLVNANLDFNKVVNEALNDYLSKVFTICPYTEEPCIKKQCIGCDSSKPAQTRMGGMKR
jgi:hypothetical protein